MVVDVAQVKVAEEFKQPECGQDEAVARYFMHHGLAFIPLSSFYVDQSTSPKNYLRIALCKDEQTTIKACQIIANL